jgi:hypothetical protein
VSRLGVSLQVAAGKESHAQAFAGNSRRGYDGLQTFVLRQGHWHLLPLPAVGSISSIVSAINDAGDVCRRRARVQVENDLRGHDVRTGLMLRP